MEPLRALVLALLLLAPAVPIGAAALRALGLARSDLPHAGERWVLAASIGLGTLAWTLTLLGLARLLYPSVVLGVPLALAACAAPSAFAMLRRGSAGVRAAEATPDPSPGTGAERALRAVVLLLLLVMAGATTLSALAPPTDYDGLLYHLVAPREYLRARSIVYLPHNFSANLPMLGEMLFAHGLAGGSDRAPQLIHAASGALAVALTATWGARFVGPAAFWGAAGLAATPLVAFLAARAYIDLFTLLFGLIAVFGVLTWRETGKRSWLVQAGAGAGLALSTKYAALTLVLVLGACTVAAAVRRCPREAGRRPALAVRLGSTTVALGPALTFGLVAALVAVPWYARQVAVLGNPVWPMYFGGRDWDAGRVEQLTYFVSQYGTGASLRDTLLLPLNVFRDSWRFGHVPDSYPPYLALAAPLALVVRRPAVRWLFAVAAGATLLWARGWQDLRFLLAVYPLFSLLGAAAVLALTRGRRLGPLVLGAAVAALLAGTTAREVRRAADRWPVVAGAEPVQRYLERTLLDHRAITYLNENARPDASVLFLGDGQIWYCRLRCIPDPAHDNLLVWFVRPGSPEAALAQLRREQVSHVLLSRRDFWYLEHQDPENRLKRQLAEFYVFKSRYLELVHEDPLTEVYRLRL